MTNKIKLAKCTPDGHIQVTPDIFEDDYWNLNLFSSNNDCEVLHIQIKLAEHYYSKHDERSALDLYRNVLDSIIKNGIIHSKYRNLAQEIYNGLVKLASSNDEYIWESCEGLLSYYDNAVNK